MASSDPNVCVLHSIPNIQQRLGISVGRWRSSVSLALLYIEYCFFLVVHPEVPKIPVSSPDTPENVAREPPMELFPPENPFVATVVSVKAIVGPKAPGKTYHIVFEHDGKFPSIEGQYIGVIPPGQEPPEVRLRYFSISSTRFGDYYDGKTLSLCVRRIDNHHSKYGDHEASHYLSSLVRGDEVKITGPYGKEMLLPDNFHPDGKIIMVATGAGIAPFKAHLRRFFMEDIPTFRFNGFAWLFHGVANHDSLLYLDEFIKYSKDYPEDFTYDWALSREDQELSLLASKKNKKKYIQEEIEEHGEEIINLLDEGAYMYLSGLKGMKKGIDEAMTRVAKRRGEIWKKKLEQYKKNNQWHEQLY